MSELTREEKQALIRAALDARTRAVAPYSRFWVGAALRSADGRVFTGCNIENAAFTPTSCAERTALFSAVSQGVTQFTDIAIVGAKKGEVNQLVTAPCGVCRQVMAEFCPPDFPIHMGGPDGRIETVRLGALLPYSFSPDHVK